jgi:flavodoxin
MKALVMYESMFGNSERVARAIAEGLGACDDVDLRDVTTVVPGDVLGEVDLLVAGGPTHALSMSRPSTREDAIGQGAGQGLASRGLREWLDGLSPNLQELAFATFDTRVSRVRRLLGSAARSAARTLRRHGGRMVTDPESFFVDDVPGPLAGDELDRARAWGQQVAAVLLARATSDAEAG